MRLLITGRSFASFRGAELGVFEEDQARALAALGHDVRFAALDTRSLRRLRPLGVQSYEGEGFRVFVSSLPAHGLPGDLASRMERRAARRLWQAVTADGWTPELVHGHFGAALAPIVRARGIPYVYTEHFSGRNRLLPAAEAEALREEYAPVSCLLTVSSAMREKIRQNTGRIARVVPNIVDVDTFQPRPQPHEGFRLVTAANLLPIKGLDVLLEAFALSGREDGELCIFGQGPEGGALREKAGELGIAHRVCFRGACPRVELAEEYARSDCFVLSSRSETFGLACAEAMAAGLPVIATRCGGPEDFVDRENGLLVPVDDAPAMAAAIREMGERRGGFDPETMARRARERFSPAAVARELTEIYQSLLDQQPPEGERDI